MIPRRDITLYKGLPFYLMRWFMNVFYRRDYRQLFRKSLEKFFGSGKVFLLSRGRFSFNLILESVDHKTDDEIIIPNYYLKELIPPLEQQGLKPVLCDISMPDLSLDSKELSSKLNTKTRFVILPHMFGNCGDVDALIRIIRAKAPNAIIIEDCAHSFGAEYKGKKLGVFGDVSLHSFDYIKPLNLLGGGALLVNNEDILDNISENYAEIPDAAMTAGIRPIVYYLVQQLVLRTPLFSIVKRLMRSDTIRRWISKVHNSAPETPSRLSAIQSLIGHMQLKHFGEKNRALKRALYAYEKKMDTYFLERIPKGKNTKISFYSLFIIMDEDSSGIEEHMFRKGIDIGMKGEVMDICEEDSSYANSLLAYKGMIQLPLHHRLSERKIKKIAKALNSYLD